jgi:hypothetical protein
MQQEESTMGSTPLLEEDLAEFCRSDSLSEDGLREIIERCGGANDPRVRKYDFFHSACCNKRITEGILRYLLGCFPNAIRYADEELRRLPIHNICRNKNVTLNMVHGATPN